LWRLTRHLGDHKANETSKHAKKKPWLWGCLKEATGKRTRTSTAKLKRELSRCRPGLGIPGGHKKTRLASRRLEALKEDLHRQHLRERISAGGSERSRARERQRGDIQGCMAEPGEAAYQPGHWKRKAGLGDYVPRVAAEDVNPPGGNGAAGQGRRSGQTQGF